MDLTAFISGILVSIIGAFVLDHIRKLSSKYAKWSAKREIKNHQDNQDHIERIKKNKRKEIRFYFMGLFFSLTFFNLIMVGMGVYLVLGLDFKYYAVYALVLLSFFSIGIPIMMMKSIIQFADENSVDKIQLKIDRIKGKHKELDDK